MKTLSWKTWLRDAAYSVIVGSGLNSVRRRMLRHDGSLRSSARLHPRVKASLANSFACQERAEIALMVANQYPGGDYFEFGSESFTSLRNFLTAFDLNGHGENFPQTKFFAFDVFGGIKPGSPNFDREPSYFSHYRDLGWSHYQRAEARLRNHNLFHDRCETVKGFFQDTLNDEFKAKLNAEGRRVGFAFLDCNVPSSYAVCFDFLAETVTDRAFIYMDEYFQTEGVPRLFGEFCEKAKQRGLVPLYVRNAGAYGALFLMAKS